MYVSFRVKFDKGFWYEMDIENMRFFCCQVYILQPVLNKTNRMIFVPSLYQYPPEHLPDYIKD